MGGEDFRPLSVRGEVHLLDVEHDDSQGRARSRSGVMATTTANVPDDERQRVRRQPEQCCGRDTEGMVWVIGELRKMIEVQAA